MNMMNGSAGADRLAIRSCRSVHNAPQRGEGAGGRKSCDAIGVKGEAEIMGEDRSRRSSTLQGEQGAGGRKSCDAFGYVFIYEQTRFNTENGERWLRQHPPFSQG